MNYTRTLICGTAITTKLKYLNIWKKIGIRKKNIYIVVFLDFTRYMQLGVQIFPVVIF